MTRATPRPGLRLTVDDGWGKVPTNLAHKDVAAVDVDADDTVYLFTRDRNGVVVLRPDGTVVTSWGDSLFRTPHGLTVAPDGTVYCVDCGDHTIRRFTPDGRLLQTIGTPGAAADTGYGRRGPTVVHLNETIERPGGPFNGCTNLTIGPTGDLYVADGYGNCRIHRLSADGELLGSWGGIGTGPGEFHLPHAICATPDGRLLVGDRENERIQVFDLGGTYLAEWTDVQRPCDIAVDATGLVYVAELWRPSGNASFTRGASRTDRPGRVSVLDHDGGVVARWGASTVMRDAPGNFIAPHGIAVDSTGCHLRRRGHRDVRCRARPGARRHGRAPAAEVHPRRLSSVDSSRYGGPAAPSHSPAHGSHSRAAGRTAHPRGRHDEAQQRPHPYIARREPAAAARPQRVALLCRP